MNGVESVKSIRPDRHDSVDDKHDCADDRHPPRGFDRDEGQRQFGSSAPNHQVEILDPAVEESTGGVGGSIEPNGSIRLVDHVLGIAVDREGEAGPGQQGDRAIDAGEARERTVTGHIGDTESPLPCVAVGKGDNLGRPPTAVGPPHSAVVAGPDDRVHNAIAD